MPFSSAARSFSSSSRRLWDLRRNTCRVRTAPAVGLAFVLIACRQGSVDRAPVAAQVGAALESDVIFSEDFESGRLNGWQESAYHSRHRIVHDPASAPSNSHYLAVTYPAGQDGGWITHFTKASDSLHVSLDVRFPPGWQGGTKLIALYGSRTDNPWSAFGKAGVCPSGADFFAAMLVLEPSGNPGQIRFYTYYPAMAREPDGVTCWGRYGDGSETYTAPLTLTPDVWHHIAFWVQLNTPGEANARQVFWVDGVERGNWSGFSFRDTSLLRLNAVQLTFSVSGGVPHTQEIDVDNVLVRASPPAS